MQDRSKTFVDRFNSFARGRISAAADCLVSVETPLIRTEEALMSYEDQCHNDGYEGVMARNIQSQYLFGYRSKDLLKVKRFLDEEYEIVDFTHGTSIELECIVFVCKTKDDQTFSVRPVGTHEERKVMYKNGASYIGKMLTVKYQELSNDGVPRFPVGLHIREDWDMGGDQ